MKNTQLLFIFFMFVLGLNAQNFNNGFNFTLPPFDGSSQTFMPHFPAYTITEQHRVTVGNDGQFYSNGQAIRFWGVNMTIGANFPSKADAPGVATRMRKMGINLVRIHHADSPSWGGPNSSIFLDGNQGTRQLNPVTQDLLEYFIGQLKQNGIFVDIELNVSRKFQESDGVLYADSLDDSNKAEILFDPHIRMLQKEFAQQLLTHVNPYTGLTLAQDPVVAMLEMNNENTILRYWKSDYLHRFNTGGLMLQRHKQMLDDLWNEWLLDKYGNDTNLSNAWGSGGITGDNLLENSDFENGTTPWSVELHETAQAALTLDNQNAYGGTYSGRLDVTQTTGTAWHIQFKNIGFSLEAGVTYELAFAARADGNYTVFADLKRDNAPYTFYAGFDAELSPNWQAYFFEFTAPEDNNDNGRLALIPNNQTGQFWFDNFSIYRLDNSGLGNGESLNNQTVRRIRWSDRQSYSPARVADMIEFYMEVQKDHFDDLRAYLRNTLNVQMPITGSNALASPADAATQEDLDYVDDHSYWEIPVLLDGNFTSPNWYILNEPMVQAEEFSAVTIAFSGQAYANKPYTISEYNHCFPNRYRTEMMPFLVSYSSYHGADGIMLFEYSSRNNWAEDQVNRFFSLHRDNAVMSMFPSFAYAFRHGLVEENPNPIILNYSREWLHNSPMIDPTSFWTPFVPFDERLAFTHTFQTGTYDAATTTDFNNLPVSSGSPYTTQTGETTLDTDIGLIKTATDRFITIGGFLNTAAPETAGDLTVQNADGFGVVSWLSLDSNPLFNTSKSLLTLGTRTQNTNMVWTTAEGFPTVNNNWGTAPTEIEPRQVTLRLNIDADYILLYPLNELGAEQNSTQIFPISGTTFQVPLNQLSDETTWWGVEAVGGGIVLSVENALSLNALPTTNGIQLEWQFANAIDAPFHIQRSLDLKHWETLDQILPTSNTSLYHYLDTKPIAGNNYYRIQQSKKDGQLITSNQAAATWNGNDMKIKIHPNPVQHTLNISVLTSDAYPLSWNIVNLQGQVMRQGTSMESQWEVDVQKLSKGVYFIEIRDDNNWIVRKRLVVS